jgi:hypothetical protein
MDAKIVFVYRLGEMHRMIELMITAYKNSHGKSPNKLFSDE